MDIDHSKLIIHHLGKQTYSDTLERMQCFTQQRTNSTADEMWILEHPAIFTLGRNGKEKHILDAGDIPIIHVDRGGQVTYHGEGQLIIYLLLDIKRKKLGVRKLVTLIEDAIIQFLQTEDIYAKSKSDAPGVYVQNTKIAALGLRISKGCSYHGLSLNIDMDLSPFQRINPCGYKGLEVTQCSNLGFQTTVDQAGERLLKDHLIPLLNYPSQNLS